MINLDEEKVKQSPMLQNYGQDRSIASSPDAFLEQAFADIDKDDQNAELDQQTKVEQDQAKNDSNSFMQHLQEIPPAIGSGLLKAVQETGNFAIDMADWVDEAVGSGQLIEDTDRISSLTNPENVFQPETTTGSLVREVTSFLLPFGAVSKAAKGIKAASKLAKFTKAGSIGFAVDFAAYDPHEERLSNLVQKNPALSNPISNFLAADKGDTRAEGRFKNALEGMFLGTGAEFLVEGMTRAVKAVKGNRVSKNVLKDTEALAKEAEAKGVDLNADDAVEQMDKLQKEMIVPEEVEIDTKPIEDLNLIKSDKELDKQVQEVSGTFIGQVDEAKRGVVTDDALKALASDLDITPEELLSRQRGEAVNAETLLAQQKITEDSANQVFDALDEALKDGGDVSKAKLLTLLNDFGAKRAQFSGARSEAARALRASQISISGFSNAEKARYLEDFLKHGGGKDGVEVVMKRLQEIRKQSGNSTKALSNVMKRGKGRLLKDAVFETWINSLLSGPKTHLVNIMSNSSVAVSSIVETGFGRASAIARGANDSVQEGEAMAMVSGLMSGMIDGMQLAAEAFKRGQPLDIATKLDEAPINAISSKRINNEFPGFGKNLVDENDSLTKFGRAVDMMATINRVPTRLLLAEDEFFKAINMRMKVHQLATRRARLQQTALGLSDEQTNNIIKDLIDNPSADITAEAKQFAKTQTFTNELEGQFANTLNDFIKSEITDLGGIQPLRIVMPFVRTPLNILNYTWDRIPVKPNNIRQALRGGGEAKDMAIARIGLGSTVMGSIGLMAANGLITGQGPANRSSNNFMRNSGWQPYSVRVGDTYIQYDRLDPWGQVVGMAADIATVLNEVGEDNRQDGLDLMATGLGIVVENMTPEFLTENLNNFLDALKPGREQEFAIKKFLTNTGANVVPFSGFFRNVTGVTDPVRREVRPDPESKFPLFEETYNKIIAKIPGLSDTLPPKRNLFGDEIPVPGPISPLATTSAKKDIVVDEMIRLGMDSINRKAEPLPGETFLITEMPPRHITKRFAGKTVNQKLDNDQYDRFVQLAAGIDLRVSPFPGKTLKEALEDEIKTQRISKQMTPAGKPTDETKRIVLKRIITSFRKAARNQLIQEDRTILDTFMEESKLRQDAINPTNFRLR